MLVEKNNITNEYYIFWQNLKYINPTQIVAILVFNNVIMTANIIVNTLVAFSIIKIKQLKNRSIRLTFLLTLSDSCIGFIGHPLITSVLLESTHIVTMSLFSQFLTVMFPIISEFLLLHVSFDRWLHIKYTNTYDLIMTLKQQMLQIFCNLFIALILSMLTLAASLQKSIWGITLLVYIIIITGTISVLYIHGIKLLRQKNNNFLNVQFSGRRENTHLASNYALM